MMTGGSGLSLGGTIQGAKFRANFPSRTWQPVGKAFFRTPAPGLVGVGIRVREMSAMRFKWCREAMSGKVGKPFQVMSAFGQKVLNSLGKTLFCMSGFRFRKCTFCAQKILFLRPGSAPPPCFSYSSGARWSAGGGAFFEFGVPTGFQNLLWILLLVWCCQGPSKTHKKNIFLTTF